MTLHEAILEVLRDSQKPMTTTEIAAVINNNALYVRKNGASVNPSQVAARVNNYNQLFDNINGEIFLTQDKTWNGFIRAYSYLKNLLYRYGTKNQSIIPYLIFYKRISDISTEKDWSKKLGFKYERNYLSHQQERTSPHPLIEGIKVLSELYPELINGLSQFRIEIEKINNDIEGNHVLIEISNTLSSIDTKHLNGEKFGTVFEYFLHKSFHNPIKDFLFTPKNLKDLMVQFADPESYVSVYDPFLGLAGIFTELNKRSKKNINYFGNEINKDIYNLGLMNLIMHEIDHQNIKYGNCLFNGYHQQFDYVISDLPLNSRINYYEYLYQSQFKVNTPFKFPEKGDALPFYILFILSKLKEGGKAIITVPDGFLVKRGFIRKFREYLIKNGYIEFVISLPKNILQNSNISLSLLVLEKKSFRNQEIKLVDLSQVKAIELQYEIIQGAKTNHDSKFSTSVGIDEIVENDVILSAKAYSEIYRESRRLIKEGKAKYLNELVKVSGGTSRSEIVEVGIPIVKSQHLNQDILDLDILIENLNDADKGNFSNKQFILKEKSLLLNRLGSKLKPTFFKPNEEFPGIILNRDVYALKAKDSNIILLEYLYYQFYSPFVQQQIKAFQQGVITPHINISQLSKIIIPVLEFQAQKDFVETQKANLIQLEKEKVEERLKIIGYQEEVADKESVIVRTLVHQLRPTLSNLSIQVEKVLRIANKNNIGNLQEFLPNEKNETDPELELYGYEKPKNYTLNEICRKLSDDSQQLNDKLTYVNKVMDFRLDVDDFQKTDIFDFLNQYLNLKKIDFQHKFDIKITGKSVVVEINHQSFKEIIDQLLINADRHAFMEIKQKRFEVNFNVKENKEKSLCILEYSNNGRDFKLTLEQFLRPFVKGQGSDGTGIGGNYIYRIINFHGGDIQLNNKIKHGFGLKFEIPQKQQNNKTYDE